MNDKITVLTYLPEHKQTWDNIVRSSRNGTFLHERSFMDYHADRFSDCSAIIMKGNACIAVFPANRSGDCVASHAGLTFGGLIYSTSERAPIVRKMFDALIDHYESLGLKKLYYKAVPHTFHRYPAEDDLHALFLKGARLVRRDLSSVLCLSTKPEISGSRKSGIKKAILTGLVIEEGKFYEQFHQLLTEVLRRHSVSPVHTRADLELLQERFPDKIKLIGAFNGRELLAASWIFHFDGVAHTQYLACSDEGKKHGALDFLISRIIEGVPPNISKISFGQSTEEGGLKVNEGLEFQKEGFGARSTIIDHYELDLGSKGFSE
jgi:hypothetical protein